MKIETLRMGVICDPSTSDHKGYYEVMVEENNAEMLQAGSALKLAYVAEGLVDIYPRFGPTMLWDVAAGQCVIEEAGGQVLWADHHHPMTYNINHMKNDSFIAMNKLLKKRVVT